MGGYLILRGEYLILRGGYLILRGGVSHSQGGGISFTGGKCSEMQKREAGLQPRPLLLTLYLMLCLLSLPYKQLVRRFDGVPT